MLICENCEKEHLGEYGSGRFCSVKCAKGYSTKIKRTEINKKVSRSLKGRVTGKRKPVPKSVKKICLYCDEEFLTNGYNRNKVKYCSQSCASKANWQKGVYDNTDWSDIHKKLYAEGRNYVAGGTTKWYDYKNIRVQGTYELRTCFILDAWKDNGIIYEWEYTKDTIPYVFEKENKTYLLDFKIYRTQEDWYYLETKGYVKPEDQAKWQATRSSGNELVVWMEKDIKKEEVLLGF